LKPKINEKHIKIVILDIIFFYVLIMRAYIRKIERDSYLYQIRLR